MKRRIAQLPLHGGKAPAWLFQRMKHLAGAVTMAIVEEYGPDEMLQRLADPWWFQAFGCALGFDWHSSGLTTVTCGAMKEAAKIYGKDLGICVAGGKGGSSRKTPQQIAAIADELALSHGDALIYASKTSAKVDSAAVQDGYQIYAHSIFFGRDGHWCVVQQGMNDDNGLARRYHWLSDSVDDFVCEPHKGLHDSRRLEPAKDLLNLVAAEADANRSACADLVRGNPDKLMADLRRYTEGPTLFAPDHHLVLPEDVNPGRLNSILRRAHDEHPADFETLLGAGVGPAAVRALALLAELIYEAPASRRDLNQPPTTAAQPTNRRWADYSYVHGGKDGTPFPVDRETYDRSINILLEAVNSARVGMTEKNDALRRLARYHSSLVR